MDSSLPVVQLKESHGLALDPDDIPRSGSFTLAVPRYPRMAINDQFILTWRGFYDDGSEDSTEVFSKTLTRNDQVLTWPLEAQFVVFINAGTAQLGYHIEYADAQGGSADSDTQTFAILPPQPSRLPVLSIENQTGGTLDPDDYPQGLTLKMVAYPGIQVGDYVLLYATSTAINQNTTRSLRVEQAMIGAGELVFTLEAQWLHSQLNETVTFEYQYARSGAAQSSAALSLAVSVAWRPDAPIIDGATAEEPGPSRGFIEARYSPNGAIVRVPGDIEVGPADRVEMHWQGYGSTGAYIALIAEPDDPRKFAIPASAIPANMGKRLDVFYTVQRPGEAQARSSAFDLRVVALPNTSLRTVQCGCVNVNKLLLSCVTSSGVEVTLPRWMFMAVDQRVTIRVESSLNESLLENVFVTQAHLTAGKVTAVLRRTYLDRLNIGSPLTIKAFVSFDEGFSIIEFNALPLTLSD